MSPVSPLELLEHDGRGFTVSCQQPRFYVGADNCVFGVALATGATVTAYAPLVVLNMCLVRVAYASPLSPPSLHLIFSHKSILFLLLSLPCVLFLFLSFHQP